VSNFIGAVVLSIFAEAYSVLAVVYFSLAGVLFTFAQGLFILSDALFIFTYVYLFCPKSFSIEPMLCSIWTKVILFFI